MALSISVVIPTCNRKQQLLFLLQNLYRLTHPLLEVIIVDSGEDKLEPADYAIFEKLNIDYLTSEKSVCIQRNIGIQRAKGEWIFLCDDDIEVPADYLQILARHINIHQNTGAVSGLWLQKEKGEWKATYPVHSARMLLWKFIFHLGIWGEINCSGNNAVIRKIKQYYKRKGNHISKAGWPVNTDFSGDYTICPVYSLGASLVRKEWLIHSPYDEVLDRHGMGDNYGVAVDFPVPGIHIVNNAFIYHHMTPVNRLKRSLQYYRRTLALDYFAKIKPGLRHVKKYCIIWSLTGNLLRFLWVIDGVMIKATLKLISIITFNKNPYFIASQAKRKVVEPKL